jgi:hypothetical protein
VENLYLGKLPSPLDPHSPSHNHVSSPHVCSTGKTSHLGFGPCPFSEPIHTLLLLLLGGPHHLVLPLHQLKLVQLARKINPGQR